MSVRRLAGHAALYTASDALTRGVPFLLIPLYARHLSVSDYGALAVLTTVSTLLVQMLGFGLGSAAMHSYYRHPDERSRRRYAGSLWLAHSLLAAICIFGIDLAGGTMLEWMPELGNARILFSLTVWGAWFQLIARTIPPSLFRVGERPVRFLAFSVVTSLAQVGAVIWRVGILDQGVAGAVRGTLEGSALGAVAAFVAMVPFVLPALEWKAVSAALRFGLPLVPHNAAQWVLGLSDRLIVGRIAGAAALGIYHLGYQFASVFQVLVSAMNSTLLPEFARAGTDRPSAERLPRLATLYALVCAWIGVSVALLAPAVIQWISPPSFHAAGMIVPWAVGGVFALGLYYVPMNFITLTIGRTARVAWITLFAGGVNVGLNLLLVPRFGAIAAAVDTLIGYATLLAGVTMLARHLDPKRTVPYEYGRIGRMMTAAAVVVGLGTATLGHGTLADFLIGMIWVLVGLPCILLVSGLLGAREREGLRAWAATKAAITERSDSL